MTFSLRHRTHLLVVFALTAAIGLSSCADTFTGYVELEPETSTEEAASLNDTYRQGEAARAAHQQGRVAPTPGDETAWSNPGGHAASQHHLGDDPPVQTLSSSDSTEAPPKPKPGPKPKRFYGRF